MDTAVDGSTFLDVVEILTAGKRYGMGRKSATPSAPGGMLPLRRTLASEAMRWTYIIRSRERWRGNVDVRVRHAQDAAETMKAFGLDDAALAEIAAAGRVVVTMPFTTEARGWEARIFPWEFVLSRATLHHRVGRNTLTVMRHMPVLSRAKEWPDRLKPDWYAGRALGPRVLLVRSFPGALGSAFNADDETERVRAAFGLARNDPRWRVLDNPSLADLQAACTDFRPEFVHLSGFDNHQGLGCLREVAGDLAQVTDCVEVRAAAEWLRKEGGVVDGYLLRSPDGMPCIVSPQQLGRALTADATHAPLFVGANMWNSAARIAPLLLSEGVVSSLGFQDAFDDSLGEYFFETLYAAMRFNAWSVPEAFEAAWAALRLQADLSPGTGIALWGRPPLIAPTVVTTRGQARERSAAAARPAPVAAAPTPVFRVQTTIEPKAEINYAELHNHGALFNRFEVRGPLTEPRTRIHVLVELHCGPERARYEAEIALDTERINLNERIRVPLTAALMRSVTEAVTSTLFIQVLCDGVVVFKDTVTLRLLPVDQWLDNEKSGQWLPSFILPRDPAVEHAITAAQRYVRVIRDDPDAGFEGYQSALATDERSLVYVDLQVEAIWAALLHEWQLGYVNPPPTYNRALDSQRLRTPSSVQRQRMGTCIDLALLFAACLELVDIHPVVFLLDGHALPGYWRHRDFQLEYRDMVGLDDQAMATGDATRSSAPGKQRSPWRLGNSGYREVWRFIREGRLVPIETVRLTEHCGFREACNAGVDALRSARDFDSILDVATARIHLVTPLPIVGGE